MTAYTSLDPYYEYLYSQYKEAIKDGGESEIIHINGKPYPAIYGLDHNDGVYFIVAPALWDEDVIIVADEQELDPPVESVIAETMSTYIMNRFTEVK